MHHHDARILRGAAAPTAAVTAVALLVAGMASGLDGAAGALIGGIVTLAFFSLGWLAIRRLSTDPAVLMVAALGVYMVQIIAVAGFLYAVKDLSALDTRALAWTVIACTLTWTIFQIRAFSREKMLYVEPRQEG